MYYYYSKKSVNDWQWTCWWLTIKEFTIIIRVLINDLNFNFKRINKTLSETKLRDFNKRN
jgi:hypothetical protein